MLFSFLKPIVNKKVQLTQQLSKLTSQNLRLQSVNAHFLHSAEFSVEHYEIEVKIEDNNREIEKLKTELTN